MRTKIAIELPSTESVSGKEVRCGARLTGREAEGWNPLERSLSQVTFLREPCVSVRKGRGEASVAVRAGSAMERPKNLLFGVPRRSLTSKPTRATMARRGPARRRLGTQARTCASRRTFYRLSISNWMPSVNSLSGPRADAQGCAARAERGAEAEPAGAHREGRDCRSWGRTGRSRRSEGSRPAGIRKAEARAEHRVGRPCPRKRTGCGEW